MDNLIKIQFILDNVPLTKIQRSEANAYLVAIQNEFQQLQEQLKEQTNG